MALGASQSPVASHSHNHRPRIDAPQNLARCTVLHLALPSGIDELPFVRFQCTSVDRQTAKLPDCQTHWPSGGPHAVSPARTPGSTQLGTRVFSQLTGCPSSPSLAWWRDCLVSRPFHDSHSRHEHQRMTTHEYLVESGLLVDCLFFFLAWYERAATSDNLGHVLPRPINSPGTRGTLLLWTAVCAVPLNPALAHRARPKFSMAARSSGSRQHAPRTNGRPVPELDPRRPCPERTGARHTYTTVHYTTDRETRKGGGRVRRCAGGGAAASQCNLEPWSHEGASRPAWLRGGWYAVMVVVRGQYHLPIQIGSTSVH